MEEQLSSAICMAVNGVLFVVAITLLLQYSSAYEKNYDIVYRMSLNRYVEYQEK